MADNSLVIQRHPQLSPGRRLGIFPDDIGSYAEAAGQLRQNEYLALHADHIVFDALVCITSEKGFSEVVGAHIMAAFLLYGERVKPVLYAVPVED